MKVEVIYKNEKVVSNCWVYDRLFETTIITWIEKREIVVKKWCWRKFSNIEEIFYKYYLHQNNPNLATTTYESELSTNLIIDSLKNVEIEKATIWLAENVGKTNFDL